jgi:hypothetical protein
VPARCSATDRRFAIESSDEPEIGDAVAYPGGVAVGLVHGTPGGRMAALAVLPEDATRLTLVDLAPTLGDAPAPRLAWRGKALAVVDYVLPRKGAKASVSRDLAVWAIDPGAASGAGAAGREPASYLAQQRDDSLAFDVAEAGGQVLVVWDEATGGSTSRGVIRASTLAGEPSHDVSPAEADAEMARVVPRGTGFFVLWVARRPDPASAAATADGAVEALGEARSFAWLEEIAVDGHGAPAGPVRRLTPATGHVSAYDVLLTSEVKPTLLVVARDEGEAVDGSGGSLLRVRVTEDSADPPLELPTDGLGRGAPSFVDAAFGARSPWLAWVALHEQLRLAPIDSAGAPLAPPSSEEGLSDSRPLLALAKGEVLVAQASPSGSTLSGGHSERERAASLSVFLCPR